MKSKLLVGLSIAWAALAQHNSPRPVPIGPAAPALGGIPVAGKALGGAPVVTRPLGGVQTARTQRRQSYRNGALSGYYGPVYYTPGPSDYAAADFWNSGWAPSPVDSSIAAQPGPVQPPPVIINQYFDSGHRFPEANDAPPPVQDNSAKPGDPLAEPANYYLIEYKDHTIYAALAYWLEGDTLHYVTTQNQHNQASLSLIDLDKTYKLNEDRSVPFSIPGK